MNLIGKTAVLAFSLSLLLSGCGSASARSTQALYVDPDPSAYAIHPPLEKRGQFLVELDQQIAREPDNAYFIAARAYHYCLDGQVAECEGFYARALNTKSVSAEDRRYVLWSKGWGMFILQRYPQAIADWKEAERLHGGKPFWVAYTLSVAYWGAGDKAQAMDYFELAVKSNKAWGNDAKRAQLTSHWKPAEKNALRELVVYWKAHRNERT